MIPNTFPRIASSITVLALSGALAACGGGNSDTTTPTSDLTTLAPPQVNTSVAADTTAKTTPGVATGVVTGGATTGAPSSGGATSSTTQPTPVVVGTSQPIAATPVATTTPITVAAPTVSATSGWTAPQIVGTVDRATPNTNNFPRPPRLLSDDNGNQMVYWETTWIQNAGLIVPGPQSLTTNAFVRSATNPAFTPTQPFAKDIALNYLSGTLDVARTQGIIYSTWLGATDSLFSYYTPTTGWSTPLALGANYGGLPVVHPDGSVTLIHTGYNDKGLVFTATHISISGGVSTPQMIDYPPLSTGSQFVWNTPTPTAAIARNNQEVFLVWTESSGDTANPAFVSRNASFHLTTGWSKVSEVAPATAATQAIFGGPMYILANNPSANELELVRCFLGGATNGISCAFQTLANGVWSNPATFGTLEESNTSMYPIPSASNATGDIMLVWLEGHAVLNGSYTVLMATRYTPATGWTKPLEVTERLYGDYRLPTPIYTPAGSFIDIKVAMNKNGDAALLWSEILSDGSENLKIRLFHPNSGWATPELVASASADAPRIGGPNVDIQNNGKVTVLWETMTTLQDTIVIRDRNP